MPITRKPGPAQQLALIGQIPDPPAIPTEMVNKFPALSQYQAEMKEWWDRYKDLFSRDRSQIQTQFTQDEASAASNLASIQGQFTQIQATLDALINATPSTPVSDLLSQLTALKDALKAHIDAAAAHGTQSQIVGVSDAQALDQKDIGSTTPGPGRFTSVIVKNFIPLGITLTVGSDEFMVAAGPYTIQGRLVIDGTVVWL